jgi:hypothetical protein
VSGSQCNCVFSHNRLSCRGVRSDKDAIAHFKVVDGLLLKGVELERILEMTAVSSISNKNSHGEATHSTRHVGNKFVEIRKLLVNIDDMRPISFGNRRSTTRMVSRDRCDPKSLRNKAISKTRALA